MSAAGTDLQRVLATFLPRYRHEHALHPRQRQVCAHIRDCRTAALGGLVEGCERCEYQSPPRFNSCRDRHCPKCQGRAAAQWGERQRERLLPVTYYHLVFTVPDALNPWVQLCPRVLYAQLFASAWATLSAFAANPRRLGGQLGATLVLHTWGRTLIQHVHLHCLVPGGVLTAAGEWCPAKGAYLFPVRALSRRFRGHFVAGLRRRQRAGELERLDPEAVDGMLDALMASDWVVYCPSPASATPSPWSPTSPATPTAPRSATSASSVSRASAWAFATPTTATANAKPCGSTPPSSSAASCCTCSPRA